MSGWGVMTWLAAIAVGPMTFLALVAHRVADGTIGLEQLEAEQRKLRQRRREADSCKTVRESKPDQKATGPPADKDSLGHERVDQSLA